MKKKPLRRTGDEVAAATKEDVTATMKLPAATQDTTATVKMPIVTAPDPAAIAEMVIHDIKSAVATLRDAATRVSAQADRAALERIATILSEDLKAVGLLALAAEESNENPEEPA
jgi:hypothetical protein